MIVSEQPCRHIQEQIERGAKTEKFTKEAEFTELKRDSEEEKVTISLGGAIKKTETVKPVTAENPFKKPFSKDGGESQSTKSESRDGKKLQVGVKRKSALDDIMEFEEMKREKTNRKDYWLHKDIVIKVVAKKLGDKYYKKKAYVMEVQDLFGAIIKMLDNGDKVRVDQSHLETVIPAQGKTLLIVNGAYRSKEAILESINEKKFCCTVSIKSGPLKGRILDKIPYEDICKIYQPS